MWSHEREEEDGNVWNIPENSDALWPVVSLTTLRVECRPPCSHPWPASRQLFLKHSVFFLNELNLENLFLTKRRCRVPLLCSGILLIKGSPGNFPQSDGSCVLIEKCLYIYKYIYIYINLLIETLVEKPLHPASCVVCCWRGSQYHRDKLIYWPTCFIGRLRNWELTNLGRHLSDA